MTATQLTTVTTAAAMRPCALLSDHYVAVEESEWNSCYYIFRTRQGLPPDIDVPVFVYKAPMPQMLRLNSLQESCSTERFVELQGLTKFYRKFKNF